MKHLPALVSVATLCLVAGCSGPPDAPAAQERVDVPVRSADGSVSHRKGEIVDDWVTLDGDILVAPAVDLPSLTPLGSAMIDLDLRWPNNEVHFRFEPAVPVAERDKIRDATKYWSLRTRVEFIEGPGIDTLVVEPASDGGASMSHVGRLGGDQEFWWRTGDGIGTAIHELGHALGLRHEHNRQGRDSHVEVCWVNIHPAYYDYFQLETESVDYLTPYDSNSMMHYRRRAAQIATIDPNVTDLLTGTLRRVAASPADPGCFEPVVDAQGNLLPGLDDFRDDDLTAEDINAVSLMYGTHLASDETGDHLGASVLIAELDDRDEWPELLAGAPDEDVGSVSNAGAVYLYRGTYRRPTPWRVITQETGWEAPGGSPVAGLDVSESRDAFGSALASGRLDVVDDVLTSWLAIGAPGETVLDGLSGANPSSGAVYTYQGRNEGVRPLNRLYPAQASGETNTNGALFGAAMASADLDNDGREELLVGAPGKDAGRVYVYSGQGLVAPGPVMPATFIKVLAPMAEVVGARFGAAITTGDFNQDGKIDIAVGAPRAGAQGTGRVFVFIGNGGLTFDLLSFSPWQTLAGPSAVNGDEFGASLATLDLENGIGHSLAVGAPGRTKTNTSAKTGVVYVYDRHVVPPAKPYLKLETTREPSTNQVQRYGASLATLPPDGVGFDELVVTAPLADNGKGRAEILHGPTGPVNMQLFLGIAAGTLVANMGTGVATGMARHDGPNPFDPETGSAVQLVLGGPRATNGLVNEVGMVQGFHVGAQAVESRFTYGQSTKMPWAL